MAYDKVIDSEVLGGDLTAVADAIRNRAGITDLLLFPSGFVDAVKGIKVKTESYEVTFPSDLGGDATTNLEVLTNNDLIKENYDKEGFGVLLIPANPSALLDQYVTHCIYHGNANIGASDSVRYGFAFQSNSSSSLGYSGLTAKISETNYNACFRARDTGNLNLYVANSRKIKAGTYIIILICWED
jgi:hypothetical protein